ncbi:hypothetical protein DFH09DRAFT_1283544 [Mycena vulgaris]|nr:hypothetical protein DFH09DRAFT_1283544 [Mycena vulgaris]
MSAPPDPTFDVHLLYGPLLVGVLFNMILYGVLVAQQLTYLQTSHKNPRWISILVWGVFFVETANTALDIGMIYEPLILHYGALPINLPTVFITQPICVMLVGFPIQLFFIWRIWNLTGQNVIPFVIFVFSLVALGGGLWTTVRIPSFAEFRRIPLLHTSATVWLIGSAGTDLCIAFSLAIALKRMKTGFAATDTVVDKIIRMTVQTGMLTVLKHLFNSALFSILDVVSFLTIARMYLMPVMKVQTDPRLIAEYNSAWNKTLGDHVPSLGRQQPAVLSAPRFALDSKDTDTMDTSMGPYTNNGGQDNGYGIHMNKVRASSYPTPSSW